MTGPRFGWGRWPRTGGYLCLVAAGILVFTRPGSAVRDATSPTSGWLVYVWATMIVVGGLMSAVGTWLDRWFGEYIGLWPLASTLSVYAVAAAASARERSSSPAGALLLAAFALIFLARWRHVAMVRKQAHLVSQAIARADRE